MDGINSYEKMLKNPGLQIIDWEFLSLHPEAILPIWQRYKVDAFFKEKIDMLRANNIYFKVQFNKYFAKFLKNERIIRR